MDDQTREWIRTRPKSVQDVLRRFPPGCLVKATTTLMVPRQGTVGRVVSYFEDGSVSVQQAYEDDDLFHTRGQCETNWLELVGWVDGCGPDDVAAVLDEDGYPPRAGDVDTPKPK